MTVDSTPRLVSDELRELLHLAREADSIELKLTVPEQAYRSTAAALGVDPLEAQIRQVFFFDTPDLRLNEAGVVARARRIQGRDERLDRQAASGRARPAARRRARVCRTSSSRSTRCQAATCAPGSMKGSWTPTAVRASVSGDKPLRRLFSKEQRAFFAAHAPEGLDARRPLGARADLRPQAEDAAGRRSPGGWSARCGCTRTARGSSSCRRSACPAKALDVADEARTFLAEPRASTSTGEQQTKTKTALDFYSAELQAQQK